MSPFLSTLKTTAKAAVVALALGAMAMPAPAMAQTFKFNFGIQGGGSSFSFGIGKGGQKFRRNCLTNNEVRRGLRRAGFEDIRFVDRRGVRVTVIAQWDENNRWYSMDVNKCTGKVSNIERVRRGHNNGPDDGFILY